MTVVPPLEIIGLASALRGAGFLFPALVGLGTWVGHLMTACLPEIILSTAALSFRRRCVVVCVVIGFAIGIAVEGQLFPPGPEEAPIEWTAVNTTFGDVSQPFRDVAASEFIQQKSADLAARVLIFPGAVVPRWSDAALALGAGLPAAQARTAQDYPEELHELGSLDFADAIDALKSADKPHANHGIAPATDAIKRTQSQSITRWSLSVRNLAPFISAYQFQSGCGDPAVEPTSRFASPVPALSRSIASARPS